MSVCASGYLLSVLASSSPFSSLWSTVIPAIRPFENSKKASINMTSDELAALARQMASDAGVDPDLVCAIASVESAWNPWAARYEHAYSYLETPSVWAPRVGFSIDTETMLQKTSFGLLQIMGGVGRQYGYSKALTNLCDPADGLSIGLIHLKSKIARYPGDENSAIAAYNAGTATVNNGVFTNQSYVDAVLAKLSILRQTKGN